MQIFKVSVPRSFWGIGLAVALSLTTTAAPISGLPACSGKTLYSSIGSGCQLGDKQFTDFNIGLPGSIPGNWELTFDVLSSGTFRLDFAQGGLGDLLEFPAGPWTVSYNVQVDTRMEPLNYITQVGVSINPGSFGEGNVVKTITDLTPGHIGFLLGSGTANTNGTNPAQFMLTPTSQWIHVVEVVTLTKAGSALSSFTDGFKQVAAVPEPGSSALMGLGLVALGVVSRRKRG